MFNYIGHTCDVCNQKFDNHSDVVVCPECGTPHHRECYKQLGHCVNEAKHSEGFEYTPPQSTVNPDTVRCPKCGANNPKDAVFCESCGISLTDGSHKSHTSPEDIRQQAKSTFVPPVVPVSMEGEHDGVAYKDMALYIGPSFAYYIHGFKRIKKEPKTKIFCWSAFLFDGLYFLYRKMWGEAVLILLAGLVLGIPGSIVLAESMGLIPSSSPLLFSHLDIVVTVCSVLSMML
ncbi:MAG: zinc-ribbon domain-containing protein, partial [Oscillospiraceae bacterium]|nr:zinc-ribbon domain-containing protein [Oscillospiraceae bacterium]